MPKYWFCLKSTSKAQNMIKGPTQKTHNTSFSGLLYKINSVLVLNNKEIKTILKILKIWTYRYLNWDFTLMNIITFPYYVPLVVYTTCLNLGIWSLITRHDIEEGKCDKKTLLGVAHYLLYSSNTVKSTPTSFNYG